MDVIIAGRYLDRYDPLTTVPNRRAFTELLQQTVDEEGRSGGLVSVLLMDIDRFRQINDIFGSATGDEVLRQIPLLLKPVLGDVAADTPAAALPSRISFSSWNGVTAL